MAFKKKQAVDPEDGGIGDIHIFSDVDKKWEKGDARVVNSYPSWYFDGAHLDDQKLDLEHRERELSSNVNAELIGPEFREDTIKLRNRIKEIEESKPKLNGTQSQFLGKCLAETKNEIAQSMFTYDDMHSGEASAQQEANRQMEPCVPVNKQWAGLFGIKPQGGKVSRDDAIRMSQITAKALGEDTNMERLRPKMMTFRTQRVTPFLGNQSAVEVDIPQSGGAVNGWKPTEEVAS